MFKYTNIYATVVFSVTMLFFAPLQAAAINYNYVEGRYVLDAEFDLGLVDVDGDGLSIGGSNRFDKDFYLFGSFETIGFDFDVDFDLFEVGAGYIKPLNAEWDANFTFSILKSDVSGPVDDDETGYGLSAGVRGMVTPMFQATAKLVRYDLDGSDTFITLAGDFFVQPNLAVGAEIDVNADYETLSLGVKYYY